MKRLNLPPGVWMQAIDELPDGRRRLTVTRNSYIIFRGTTAVAVPADAAEAVFAGEFCADDLGRELRSAAGDPLVVGVVAEAVVATRKPDGTYATQLRRITDALPEMLIDA